MAWKIWSTLNHDPNSNLPDKHIINLPSRELAYPMPIPPLEKEYHLQNCFFRGYVRCNIQKNTSKKFPKSSSISSLLSMPFWSIATLQIMSLGRIENMICRARMRLPIDTRWLAMNRAEHTTPWKWTAGTLNQVGGGFKYFSCSPLLREIIQFDEHMFQMGWNHPLRKFTPSAK